MIIGKLKGIDDRFPYLLALVTSANIGSALTNVGNPQNTLIAISAGLSFVTFIKFMVLPVFASMIVNILMLCVWCRDELEPHSEAQDSRDPEALMHVHRHRHEARRDTPAPGSVKDGRPRHNVFKDRFTEDFLRDHIDTPLLLLFSGQCIMVTGVVNTGIPKCFWEYAVPTDPLDTAGHTVGFVIAIVLLSNLISNVPLVLMMRPMLSKLMHTNQDEAKAVWLVVAFVCKFCTATNINQR
jgi:Na+/H+ antiporter NhaD/arsenite permease-like protein